jgi:hypothetical protein
MINSQTITDGTDTTLYSSVGTTALTVMIFCNTATPNSADETENAVSLELHVVKSGTAISSANAIVKGLVVPAGETVFFDTERLVLDNGDFVSGKLVAVNGSGSITSTVSALAV